MQNELGLISAFSAGLISFLSPCVLPLVPAYLSFLAGASLDALQGGADPAARRRVLLAASGFVLGFTLIFMLLGASATFLGQWLGQHTDVFQRVAGALLILLGLHVAGWLRIPFLLGERRLQVRNVPLGFFGAWLVGMAFAFGWTPCIGPLLAGILALAGSRETLGEGLGLLGAYSLGLGLPFLAAAAAVGPVLGVLQRIKRHLRWIEIAAGVLLIGIGAVMLGGNMMRVAGWFSPFGVFAH